MKKYLIVIVIFSISYLGGCYVHSTSVRTGGSVAEPLSRQDNVSVHLFDEHVADFEEIGLVEVMIVDSVKITFEEIVSRAINEARSLGANCIIYMKNFYNQGPNCISPTRFAFRAGIVR